MVPASCAACLPRCRYPRYEQMARGSIMPPLAISERLPLPSPFRCPLITTGSHGCRCLRHCSPTHDPTSSGERVPTLETPTRSQLFAGTPSALARRLTLMDGLKASRIPPPGFLLDVSASLPRDFSFSDNHLARPLNMRAMALIRVLIDQERTERLALIAA